MSVRRSISAAGAFRGGWDGVKCHFNAIGCKSGKRSLGSLIPGRAGSRATVKVDETFARLRSVPSRDFLAYEHLESKAFCAGVFRLEDHAIVSCLALRGKPGLFTS